MNKTAAALMVVYVNTLMEDIATSIPTAMFISSTNELNKIKAEIIVWVDKQHHQRCKDAGLSVHHSIVSSTPTVTLFTQQDFNVFLRCTLDHISRLKREKNFGQPYGEPLLYWAPQPGDIPVPISEGIHKK